jgi:hypothetical protein
MNAKWMQQNLAVLVAAGVYVLAMGAVLWLQQQAAAKKRQVEQELAAQQQELTRILAVKPAPSPGNLTVLTKDREQLEQLLARLLESVGRSTVEPKEPLRPIALAQRMAETFARLRHRATERGVELPEGFAFGFSRYIERLPARTLPEEQARVVLRQLDKQLLAVEKITALLLDSGVEELRQIRRAEVEPGAPGPDALPVSIIQEPGGLYQALPFEFQFACNTESLRAFLNSLSRSEWFFAVRSLRIDREAVTVQPAATETAQPQERARLAVTLRVDLVEFGGGAKPAT